VSSRFKNLLHVGPRGRTYSSVPDLRGDRQSNGSGDDGGDGEEPAGSGSFKALGDEQLERFAWAIKGERNTEAPIGALVLQAPEVTMRTCL
jgi:hypothetical protein